MKIGLAIYGLSSVGARRLEPMPMPEKAEGSPLPSTSPKARRTDSGSSAVGPPESTLILLI